MKKKGKSLFGIVIGASVVCVALITLLIFGSASGATKRFEEQFIRIEQAETDAVASMLDKDVAHALGRMYNIVVGGYVAQAALYLADAKYSLQLQTAVQAIQTELFSLESSAGLPWSTTLYLPQSGRKITANAMVPFAGKEREEAAARMAGDTVCVVDGELTLRASVPFSYKASFESASAVLLCRMQMNDLKSYLQAFSKQGDGSQFAVSVADDAGRMETVTAYTPLGADAELNVAQLLVDREAGSGFYALAEGRHLLTWKKIEQIPGLYLWQMTGAIGMADQIGGFVRGIVLGYCGAAVILLALVYGTFLLISRPIAHMSAALVHFDQGKLDTRIGASPFREFREMYGQFDKMAQRIQTLIETEYELRLLHFQAELKQVQYQINPHFLYNTYFILRAMLYGEAYDDATRLAELMGKYLRYITVSGDEYARLAEEIGHTQAYAEIQQCRFRDKMAVEFAPCPPAYLSMRVPRLILQPLVENAFVHGVKHNEGPGHIRVSFEQAGQDLLIRVEDNGEGTSDAAIACQARRLEAAQRQAPVDGGVALTNIHRRLRMIYGEDGGVSIARSSLGGACVTVRIAGKERKLCAGC